MTSQSELTIHRHKIGAKWASQRFKEAVDDLPVFYAGARRDPSNLSMFVSGALDVVRFGSVADPTSVEIPKALRLAGEGFAILFQVASAPNLPIEVKFDDDGPTVYASRPDASAVHAGKWIQGFFVNCLCRQNEQIDLMCHTDLKTLRASSSIEPEYRFDIVRALQSFWAEEADTPKKVMAAIANTDPDRVDIRSPEWALNIDVPMLQNFFYVVTGDDEFGDRFPEAVRLHKQFWTSSVSMKKNPEGFVAFELTAIAALAYDRGLEHIVESEYVPRDLVRFGGEGKTGTGPDMTASDGNPLHGRPF